MGAPRICVWHKPYHFRMFDPSLIQISRKREPHRPLAQVVALCAARARWAGHQRSANRLGRYFAVLSRDMLEARLCGVSPRILRGVGA